MTSMKMAYAKGLNKNVEESDTEEANEKHANMTASHVALCSAMQLGHSARF